MGPFQLFRPLASMGADIVAVDITRRVDEYLPYPPATDDDLGSIDIVIANAGICEPAKWQDIAPQSWQDTIDINLTGAWNTITATAQHMIDAGNGGAIVIISSYAGKKVQPMMIHYTSSKHALVGMTRGFAIELGPHRTRVNSVLSPAVAAITSEHVSVDMGTQYF